MSLFFRKKPRASLSREVSLLHFRLPAGLRAGSENPVFPPKKRFTPGFLTLTPPENRVLDWSTSLSAYREKCVLAINLSRDIVRQFSLVYDFADFLIVDPDADDGIASPDLSDTTALLDELISLRLCYEKYTPIFLRLAEGLTPEEIRALLSACRLSGIDGVVAPGIRKVRFCAEETQGRYPIIGSGAQSPEEALEQFSAGASLVETQLRPIPFVRLVKLLENQQ